jgi:hypothetical protein
VAWREDHQHAYTGNGPRVMATIRNLALAILRLTGHRQITRTLQRIAADRTLLLSILAASHSPPKHDQLLCNRAASSPRPPRPPSSITHGASWGIT